MAASLLLVAEVARVDGFERRRFERQTQELATCSYHGVRCLRPDVPIRLQPPMVRPDDVHTDDAGNALEPRVETGALGFEVEIEVATEHLTPQLLDGTE